MSLTLKRNLKTTRKSRPGLRKNTSKRVELIALDTETTGLFPHHGAKPFLVSICTEAGRTRVWEWKVEPVSRQPIIPEKDRKEIVDYLAGKHIIFHHGKFDMRMLGAIGIYFDFSALDFTTYPHEKPTHQYKPLIALCVDFDDTLLASHAVASSDEHGLKPLAVKYLDIPSDDEKALKEAVEIATRYCRTNKIEIALGHDPTGKRETAYDYWVPKFVDPKSTVCRQYAVKDVERTVLLWLAFRDVIEEEKLTKGYQREKRLLQTVYRTESEGISINEETLEKKIEELETGILSQEKAVQRYLKKKYKTTCNLNSNKDLPVLLYKTMKYPVVKKTKKGGDSTDKDAMVKLLEIAETKKKSDEIKNFFIPYLKRASYQSAVRYCRSYRSFAVKPPGYSDTAFSRLYPSLNQSATHTTRFSSNNPNGQNVSGIVEVEIGKFLTFEGAKLREIFGPRPGKIWVDIDYDQLELRVFAAASQEQSLIEALNEGYDFHAYVACRIFNKPLAEITKQERRIAKSVNFALIFGAGEAKVDATAGMKGAYKLFGKLFPNVMDYMQKTIKEVRAKGYVTTLDGYRLDVNPHEPYKGVNYRVQGTAGSIVKQAMIDIDQEFLVDWIRSRIVLQVHDELIIEFDDQPDCFNPRAVYNICRAMEEAGNKLGVTTPVKAEIIRTNWASSEKVEVTKTKFKPYKAA